ncbi:putative ribonuclease h protein [Quercus suber]|uniref:Ribonuclease h protein n=1 Tax=Quercus suber TaxID=58331 RepID=A0AAW0J568_QUESU
MAETLAKVLKFAYLGLNERLKRTTRSIQVRWLPPPENWFKLNSDRSSLGNLGKAGGGGIIRNSIENWVRGYARAIGHTISVAAELWALRDGINLCIDLNLTNVLIEMDAKIVVER